MLMDDVMRDDDEDDRGIAARPQAYRGSVKTELPAWARSDGYFPI
jgi:hypothetical protein